MDENLNKVKILFRHRSMEMGGVEKVLLSILSNLNPEKFEMTVCLNLNQGELRDEFPKHVRKVYISEGKEDFSKNPLIQKAQLFKRSQQLKKYQKNPELVDQKILKDTYDIEVGMTYNDFEMVLNSSNKKSKKVGWFHSEINIPGFEVLVPGIIKQFPHFDRMVYCSQKIHDLMHVHHPDLHYPSESVITNAIPVDEIRKKAEEKITDLPHSPVFVSVGRLHHRKGYHKLIEAHKKVLDQGFPHNIVIIGDGEEKKNLEELIIHHQVEKSFKLIGNRMNPYPYIKNSDYFILSSMSEAWPLVIAEALLLQKPTIATKTGDIPKMIIDNETGLLIDYESDAMANAMIKFLNDKEYINRIKTNLVDIEKQFDNAAIFQSIEDMFLETLNKPTNNTR